MDEVVAESHLELLLRFVEVSVEHLQDGVLSVDLSVVVLLVDLDLLFQLLGFSEPQQFSPMCENLHPVEVSHFLFLNHLDLEVIFPLLEQLLLLLKILDGLVNVLDSDHHTLLLWSLGSSLDQLS